MAKKNTPIITHTEILNRAIRDIEGEISGWAIRCEALPPRQREEMFSKSTETLMTKLEALKEMYRIETGTEYT